MTLFDLLFILLFLTTVATLGTSLVSAVRGKHDRALRRLRWLGLGLVVYMGIVSATSLLSSRRVLALGEPACSDDWCIAVDTIESVTIDGARMYEAVFRLSSRARRAPQRERFVVAYMLDASGRRYDAEARPGEAPFDSEMGPGDFILTRRLFHVPEGSTGLGVVVGREGDLAFPRCCIIGSGPFYKPPIWYAE